MVLSHFLNRIVLFYRRGRTRYIEGNGRDEVFYVEGEKRVRVYTELQTEGLIGRTWTRLTLEGVGEHWEPPYESDLLTPAKRQEVLSEVCSCFDLIGESYEVADALKPSAD